MSKELKKEDILFRIIYAFIMVIELVVFYLLTDTLFGAITFTLAASLPPIILGRA